MYAIYVYGTDPRLLVRIGTTEEEEEKEEEKQHQQEKHTT
jgi:hypothetical protein